MTRWRLMARGSPSARDDHNDRMPAVRIEVDPVRAVPERKESVRPATRVMDPRVPHIGRDDRVARVGARWGRDDVYELRSAVTDLADRHLLDDVGVHRRLDRPMRLEEGPQGSVG